MKLPFMNPGPGWRHLSGSVWENRRGTRVHISGHVIRFADGTTRAFYQICDGGPMFRFLVRAGRNNRRAALTLARIVEQPSEQWRLSGNVES